VLDYFGPKTNRIDRAEPIQLVDWIARARDWPKPQADAAKAAIDLSRALKEARATAKAPTMQLVLKAGADVIPLHGQAV